MSGQARMNKFKHRKLKPLKEQGTSEEGEEECLLNGWTD